MNFLIMKFLGLLGKKEPTIDLLHQRRNLPRTNVPALKKSLINPEALGELIIDYPDNYPPKDSVCWTREVQGIAAFSPDQYLVAGHCNGEVILKLNNGTWKRGRED